MKTLQKNHPTTIRLNFTTMNTHITQQRMRLSALFLALAASLFIGLGDLHAQRLSITANINSFESNRVQGDQLSFAGSTNLGVNLRWYTRSKFAIRVGAGLENLNYSVSDGLSTDFDSKRQDLKGVVGLEWHPTIGDWLDIYPGLYMPLTITGDDVVAQNINQFSGGNFSAGLGAVIGANIRFLKILRVGVEFDAKYENFKSAAWESISSTSVAPLKRINYNTNLTVGVLF